MAIFQGISDAVTAVFGLFGNVDGAIADLGQPSDETDSLIQLEAGVASLAAVLPNVNPLYAYFSVSANFYALLEANKHLTDDSIQDSPNIKLFADALEVVGDTYSLLAAITFIVPLGGLNLPGISLKVIGVGITGLGIALKHSDFLVSEYNQLQPQFDGIIGSITREFGGFLPPVGDLGSLSAAIGASVGAISSALSNVQSASPTTFAAGIVAANSSLQTSIVSLLEADPNLLLSEQAQTSTTDVSNDTYSISGGAESLSGIISNSPDGTTSVISNNGSAGNVVASDTSDIGQSTLSTAVQVYNADDTWKLFILNSSSYADIINNCTVGDTIDLIGVGASSNPTLGPNNMLTVQSTGGSPIILNLDPNQNYSGQKFLAISDGNGGTNISLGATFTIVGNGTKASPEIPVTVGDTITISAIGTINVGNLISGVNALQTPAGQANVVPGQDGLILVDPTLTPFSLIGSVGGYNDFEIGSGVSTTILGPPGEVGEFQIAFNALAKQEVVDLVAFDYPYTNYFQVGTESDQFEAGTSGSWQVTVSITNGGSASASPVAPPSWRSNSSGNWSTPSNWSGAVLPGSTDDVTIDTTTPQTVTHDTGADTIHSLTMRNDTLNVTGGTLSITGLANFGSGQLAITGATVQLGRAPANVTSLSLQSSGDLLDTVQATLESAGVVTVTGNATIGNAILTGPGMLLLTGTTTLQAGSIEYLGQSFAVDSGFTLANSGLFNLDGGEVDDGYVSTLGGNGGGTIENLAGGTFNIAAGHITSIGGIFTNAGLLQVSAATGATSIDAALYNTGTVVVAAGTLSLNGGGLSSNTTFSIAATAGITFGGGTFTFASGAPVTIAGALAVDAGTLQLSASSLTTASLTISDNGTLSGTGIVTVSGPTTLARGLQSGTGTTELMGTTSVTAETDLGGGRVLQNYGTMNWTDPQNGLIEFGIGAAGGTLENMSGATFNLESDGGQIGVRSGAGLFTNAGIITQTLVTGQTDVQPLFVNSGLVNIQAGTFSLDGGGSSSASAITVAAGAALSFENRNATPAAFTFTGGTLNLAGALRIENGAVDASNVVIASIGSSLSVDGVSGTGGTLELGNQNFSVLSFEEGQGSLVGAGTITVTGAATFNSGGGQALQAGPGLTILLGTTTVTNELALDNDRTIDNAGTFSWQSGNIDLGRNINSPPLGDGTIDNASGGLFDITHAGQISAYTGTDAFINAGTLQQRHTSGQTIIQAAFANTGAVVVQSGTLEFDSNVSSNASAFAVAAGAGLQFGNVSNIGGSVAITGGAFSLGGALIVAYGTLEFGANSMTISAASAILDGSIDGTGTLTVTAPVMITAFGIETGRGVTILQNTTIDAPGDLDNAGGFVINGGRDVKNAGTMVWTGGTIGLDRLQYSSGSGGGTLENLAGSTIDVETNAGMYEGNGTAIFANAGLVRQFGVTGTSEIRAQVTNTGTLSVVSGGMDFTDLLVNDGTLAVTSGTFIIQNALTADRGQVGITSIGSQGTVWLQAGAASTQTIDFIAPDATLELSHPESAAAAISDIQVGDVIDLVNVSADSAVYSVGRLTILNAGSLVASLSVSGNAAVKGFEVSSSNGSTQLLAASSPGGAGTPSVTGGGATSTTDTVLGADGTIRSVPFGLPSLAALGARLLAGTTPASTLFLDAAGNAAMSSGQTAAVDDATGSVSLTGSGAANETIAAGSGAFTYTAGTGSGTVIAGAGNDEVILPGGGNWLAVLGSGADTVVALTGNDTIGTGTGGNFVFLGAGASSVGSSGVDTILGGTGSATIAALGGNSDEVFSLGAPLQFIAGTGASTVVAGAVATTLFGGASGGSLVFADGQTQYSGAGATDTVVGLAGSMTVQGGAGGGLFFGGTAGGNMITAGSGNATAFGGGSGDVLTATAAANDLFAGGVGAETLTGAGSTGNNTFFAGFGPETLIGGGGNTALVAGAGSDLLTGGSGLTLFLFVNGRTVSGADTISGWDPTHDFVKLAGYSGDEATTVASATLANGSSTIALSDGTHITFAGVTQLNTASFT